MSPSDRYSKCVCSHCGGHIEFPTEGEGRTIPCPHCQHPLVLTISIPMARVSIGGGPAVRKRIFQMFFIAAIVVIVAGAGAFWFVMKGQQNAATEPPPAAPRAITNAPDTKPAVVVPVVPLDPWHGLMVGPIALEKAGDGHLVYAVGKLRNASDRQRFGVKVELDVLDADNQKVGTATDYTASIDPGKEWKFHALVVNRNAAAAKLTAVKED